ncbi:MAG: BolA family protein [Pseudomonadota bacterium]
MSVEKQIEDRMHMAFTPVQLEIINESHLHSHHRSSPGTGESHFRIKIQADAFTGKSRIERHRMIHDVLAEQLAGPIHALSIQASGC